MTGSNRRPSACKADALPAELITLRLGVARILGGVVGDMAGFVTGQEFVVDGGMSKKMVYEA